MLEYTFLLTWSWCLPKKLNNKIYLNKGLQNNKASEINSTMENLLKKDDAILMSKIREVIIWEYGKNG